jgi:phage-related protein
VAEFNAGSIESTLTLDRDPFTEGLELAKQQANEFADQTYSAKVDVDDTGAKAKIDELKAELDSMGDKTIHVTVDEDRSKFDSLKGDLSDIDSEAGKLETSMDGAGGSIRRAESAAADAGGGGGGFGLLAGTLATLSPLLDPILGFGLGAVSSFGVAATGLGAFAAFAVPTFKEMTSAQKDLTTAQTDAAKVQDQNSTQNAAALAKVQAAQEKLNTATNPTQRAADLKALQAAQENYNKVVTANLEQQKTANDAVAKAQQATVPSAAAFAAYQHMISIFKQVQTDVGPGILSVFTQAFNLASQVLPELEGVVNATSAGLSTSISQLKGFLTGPELKGFMQFVQSNIGSQLSVFTNFFTNFAGGFINLIERSAPLMQAFDNIIGSLGKGFEKMTVSPAFTKFVDAIAADMPAFAQLGGDIFKGIGDILVHLEPAVPELLQFLDALVHAIDTLVTGGTLDALVKLLITFLQTITPALPAIADMLNSVIVPLANALVPVLQALQPLMPVLGPLIVALLGLKALEGPLGVIIGLMKTIVALVPATTAAEEEEAAAAGGGRGAGLLGNLGKIATGATAGFIGGQALGKATEQGTGTQGRVARDLTSTGGAIAGAGVATGQPEVIAAGAIVAAAGEIVDHWKLVTQAFDDSKKAVDDFWHNSIEPFLAQTTKDVDNWTKDTGNAFSQFFTKDIPQWASDAWKDTSGFFSRMYSDVSGFVSRMYSDVSGFFTRMYTDITNAVTRAYTNVTNFFTRMYSDVVNAVTRMYTGVTNFFSRMYSDISNDVSRGYTSVANFFSRMYTDVVNAATRIYTDVSGFFSRLYSSVTNFASRMFSDVSSFFSRMYSGVVSSASRTYSDVVSWFSRLYGDVVSWASRAVSDTLTWFASLPQKIVQSFGSAVNILTQVGENIIGGILKGITSSWHTVTDWLSSAVSHLPGPLKTVLKALSPSQLMADEVGQWIPKGIALGISKHWGSINDAMGDINLGGKLGSIALGGGNVNHNNFSFNINNPVGETTDTSVHRTMQKVRFHGLLPPEVWNTSRTG